MADDDVDHDLLDFMRKAMGLDPAPKSSLPPNTKVLESARYIFDNAIDVALDPKSVKMAARSIYQSMQEKSYSTSTWSEHELHPKEKDEDTANFIFTMDVLNFSFWSESNEKDRFGVSYGGKRYTGYWSLVALLRRALDEGLFSIVRYGDNRTSIQAGVRLGTGTLLSYLSLYIAVHYKQACMCQWDRELYLRVDIVCPYIEVPPLSPVFLAILIN